MHDTAVGTLARADKGPVAPPPVVAGPIGAVAAAVGAWPGIATTTHWDLYDPAKVDGIDFYAGEAELGHIHLDGSIHLATSPALGAAMVAEAAARPFPYARGWVCADVAAIGPDAAIALFRRNYDRLTAAA